MAYAGYSGNKYNTCTLVMLSYFIGFIIAGDQQGHLLPIGKQRLPDSINVEQLKFSPEGERFYRKYLQLYKPVVIKNAAKDWPLVAKWNDLSNNNQGLLAQLLPVKQEHSISKETIRKLIEKKLEVETVISRNSKLLEEINLPFILQCQEFVSKLYSVDLRINSGISNKLQFNSRDEIIVAFDKPLFVLIFGINKTLSGESIQHANMAEIDVEIDVADIPYQSLEIHPGDLFYIPKYSWYHIGSLSEVSYTKIKFDYYSFNLNKDIPYANALEEYKQYLLSSPSMLKCNNTKSSFRQSLNLVIDFQNELETSHLRIPKKNKRPDDIVLASGYKMPVLGLGTALLNESTYDAVKYALKDGYRLFELAHGYPFSETSFSKALAESSVQREDVFVVTKLAPRFLGYNETLYAIEESLERLNSSYIDLYLIHSKECDDFLLKCNEGEPKGTWKESWRAMEYAMKHGKIRSLGVSNFYEDDIYELLNWSVEPVSVVQNWFDPFNPDKECRKICSEYNIRYMGYSTLGNYWKMLGMDFNPVFASSTLTGIAANYDYVVASVVLRWAIHENVTVIPRSSNPKHIGQNIRALDLSLLQEECDLINGFDEWMSEVREDVAIEDLAKWSNNATTPSEDLTKSDDDLTRSNKDVIKLSDDLIKPNVDSTKPNEDLSKPSDDSNNIGEDANSNERSNKPTENPAEKAKE